MLHIENASIAFGPQILFSHFDLHLQRGEMASVSGPSGCGKSSLLNAVLGFIPLKEGSITVNGIRMDRNSVDQIRKQTAWIPQDLAFPHEWVKEVVHLPFELKANRHLSFSENRLFAFFEELGLEQELYGKRMNQISGGQRQRIMIAVAALLDKPLIVADEPTSALDSESAERTLAFFRKRASEGCAVLAVSHDKILATGCDQHIKMEYGNC